jgi:hypothetical protein
MIMETEELIVKKDFIEMEEFCASKGWLIDYSYITPETHRTIKHNNYKYPSKWKPKSDKA